MMKQLRSRCDKTNIIGLAIKLIGVFSGAGFYIGCGNMILYEQKYKQMSVKASVINMT
jgi:hypothetical protein